MRKYVNIKIVAGMASLFMAIIVYGLVGGATDNPVKYGYNASDIEESAVYLKLFSKFLDAYSQNIEAGITKVNPTLRDPFSMPTRLQPRAKSARKKRAYRPRLKLSGILWSEFSASAVINNKIYDVGQKIGKYEIRSISSNTVVFGSNDNDRFTLSLRKKRGASLSFGNR